MAGKIAIASDHGGYKLKEQLKKHLELLGYKTVDVGTDSDKASDYPDYGYKAAELVSLGKAKKGIVICRSGIGMSIVANKLRGVRAGLCLTVDDAITSRQHNDANVLSLSADRVKGKKALSILEVWLKTKTLPGRHARRVSKIKAIDKKVFK